jgi:hypothetical protein
MKAYRGNSGMAPLIVTLVAGQRTKVNFTLQPLYPRKRIPAAFGGETERL